MIAALVHAAIAGESGGIAVRGGAVEAGLARFAGIAVVSGRANALLVRALQLRQGLVGVTVARAVEALGSRRASCRVGS